MKMAFRFGTVAATTAVFLLDFVGSSPGPGPSCPVTEEIRSIRTLGPPFVPPLLFFPAFAEYSDHNLYVTSFHPGMQDFVVRINNIDDAETGDPYIPNFELLTDLSDPQQPPKTVWPNDVTVVPDGVLPFHALLIPQGFFFLRTPGRLTVVDLDDPDHPEYVVAESVDANGWFYHNGIFHDMDNDGFVDIITVRSNFNGAPVPLPEGQLVWLRNPGPALDQDVPWQEVVLYSSTGSVADPAGPDILVKMQDFDEDGIPEFVTTSFFSSEAGQTILFGKPPEHEDWSEVDATNIRAKVVVDGSEQGKPFGLEIVDLNGDKRPDLLMTNHQSLFDTIKGRVYAVEQPASGNIFVDDWTTHVLMDNINATAGPPRLAPGFAKTIYPFPGNGGKTGIKPWILLGGDQASKVWWLAPRNPVDKQDWEYDSYEVFDIAKKYENYDNISTIGEGIGVRSLEGEQGDVIIYIPVYEAGEVWVYRLKDECRRYLRGKG